MRLLTKNTLVYLVVTVAVFLVGGLVFYSELNKLINEETSESLFLKKGKIFSYIGQNKKLPDSSLEGEILSFIPTDSPVKETLKDTMLYNSYEEEVLPYRELSFAVTFSGQNYKASVRAPLLESEDLIEAVTTTLIIISIALLIIMLSVNYFFSKNIWKPFFKTVKALDEYDITKHSAIITEKSNTLEFQKLNEAIKKMTSKISADFQSLKSFTENASHEIQTPLAIIKTKIELLIQSENHSEEEMRAIQTVYEAASRLSKLNQALLLLTKIENQQFSQKEKINLSALVKKHIENYGELMEAKEIKFVSGIDESIFVSSSSALMDVLFGNLITNAIKHNKKGGEINLKLSPGGFVISNSGTSLRGNASELFERFKKDNAASESLGLGLSIVKKICETENFSINYSHNNSYHTISLGF